MDHVPDRISNIPKSQSSPILARLDSHRKIISHVETKTPDLTASVDSDSDIELKPRVLKFTDEKKFLDYGLASTSSSEEEGRGKEVKREDRRGTKDKKKEKEKGKEKEKEGREREGKEGKERKVRTDKNRGKAKSRVRESEGVKEEDRAPLPRRSKTEDGTRQKTRAVDIKRTKEKESTLADSEGSEEDAGWRGERGVMGGGSWGALAGSPSKTGFWIETASLKGRREKEDREEELAGSDEDSEEARPSSGRSSKV